MLIGIAGKKRSGKNTVAEMLSQHLLGPVYYLAFADKLKDICSVTFGIDRVVYDDQSLKESDRLPYGSARDQMITLSDVIKGKYGCRFFIRVVENQIASIRESTRLVDPHIIVTDVRYEIEAAMIRAYGGLIIHILRDTGEVSTHSSEDGIVVCDTDYVLSNEGTLSDLYEAVRGMVSSNFKRKKN